MNNDLSDYLAHASPDVRGLNEHLLKGNGRETEPTKPKRQATPKAAVAIPQPKAIQQTAVVVDGYDPSWGYVEEWTGPEKRFAREHLLPMVLNGEYLWVMPQVQVYMIGQRYTFDFVALRRDGGADHYEVKGSYQLGSEERASAKIRWAASYLLNQPGSLHHVFWVAWRSMRGQPEQWHIREIHPERKLNPVFQEDSQ